MIAFNPVDHSYKDGDKSYTSVTQVIGKVMKREFDKVDPDVLEHARQRGIRTEAYATEILATGTCSMPGTEWQDVADRVECFYSWYQAEEPELISAQQIVWDDDNDTAGQLDWLVKLRSGIALVDCKCTAAPYKTWPVQIGGYSWMGRFPHDSAGALHVNPAYEKGWIWRPYDMDEAQQHWRTAVEWWKVLEKLKAEA